MPPKARDPAAALQRRVHVAVGARDLDAGMVVYEEMRAAGMTVKTQLYNSLVHLAAGLGNLVGSFLPQPLVVACRAVMVVGGLSCGVHVCVPSGCGGDSFVFRWHVCQWACGANSCVTPHWTCVCVSQGVCDRLLADMAAAGIAAGESTFACLIRGAGDLNQAEAAFKYYDAMQASGAECRLRSFSPLLAMLARIACGEVVSTSLSPADAGARLETLFLQLKATEVDIGEADYVSVIRGYGATGRRDAAFTLLGEMMETVFTVSQASADFLTGFFSQCGPEWKTGLTEIGPE